MHSHKVIILSHAARSWSTKFLHMSSNAQKKTNMDTKSPNVCSSFTGDSKNTQSLLSIILQQFRLIDCPHTELSLYCRYLWRLLEETACKNIQDILQFSLGINWAMESHNPNILFTRSLLRLGQSSCSLKTNNQTSGNFRIEGSWVSCPLDVEDFLDPWDNFMGAGIGRFIKIDNTILKILFKRSFKWCGSCRDGSIVSGQYIHLMIVLEE